MSSNPTPELDLLAAARAYREAIVPLDDLKAAEKAAYDQHVDARGMVTGTPGSYQAYMDAVDARQEREGLIHRTRSALCGAALLPPADPGFCSCEGFTESVARGVIKHASHQMLNTVTGTLRTVQYFHIGPDSEAGVIIQYCPGCGRTIKVNQEAMAVLAGEEGHA